MSKLKLTKKIAGNRLIFSPKWITNGHWAIKRELVENGEHFNATIAQIFLEAPGSSDMTDEQIAKGIPADPDFNDKYEMSAIILNDHYEMRVFFNSKNKYVFVDENYRNLLGVETLYPSLTLKHLMLNEESDKALMCLRISSSDNPRLELAMRALDSLKDGAL